MRSVRDQDLRTPDALPALPCAADTFGTGRANSAARSGAAQNGHPDCDCLRGRSGADRGRGGAVRNVERVGDAIGSGIAGGRGAGPGGSERAV